MARASARSLMDSLNAELENDVKVVQACENAFTSLIYAVGIQAQVDAIRGTRECPIKWVKVFEP